MSKGDYSFEVPPYDGVQDMPTREECRSQAEVDYPSDLSNVFQRGNVRRTIHEREKFEERVRRKSVTQKDIEAIYDGLKGQDDRNVVGDVDPIEIDVTGKCKSCLEREGYGFSTLANDFVKHLSIIVLYHFFSCLNNFRGLSNYG